MSASDSETNEPARKKRSLGHWIGIGLALGILAGVFFGESCGKLQVLGNAYVGLLQMTVLPYLVISLISKMGRLNVESAKLIGRNFLLVMLILWVTAIVLVVLVSGILPPIEGASFYNPEPDTQRLEQPDFMSRFIPANLYRSLSREYVPAVVVFCLFFGGALMLVPGKEPLLGILDLCADGLGRINTALIRMAPFGLFALTAAAAGTLHIEELSRLQGYLIMFALACGIAAFGVMPLLLCSLTDIRYRDLIRAAEEPLLTAVATGKLFVVLPQIVEKCEEILSNDPENDAQSTADDDELQDGQTTASVIVPLAYPFPHVGKILTFVFISFAAWYSGESLSPPDTAKMATMGAVSSFASPIVTVPYLLDQYRLPQDLMALFILPGFITMRLGDVVGVMHLMVLTLIVSRAAKGRLQIRWRRLATSGVCLLFCLLALGTSGRLYLASTTVEYDLDKRFMALEIQDPYENVTVLRSRREGINRPDKPVSTLQRIREERILRVGYHPDRLPYSYFNAKDHLVGLDIELMHRLARELEIGIVFVPYQYETLTMELESGEIDVALGGLPILPDRMLELGCSQPYQTATIAIVLPDYRRREVQGWMEEGVPDNVSFAVLNDDMARSVRRRIPTANVVVIDSVRDYFAGRHAQLDALVMPAESAAAWNILYPRNVVIVPEPVMQRPVGMAVRLADQQWLRFLDRWLDFEKLDGSIDQLRVYWVHGGGTKKKPPRWCVMRDVLGWMP